MSKFINICYNNLNNDKITKNKNVFSFSLLKIK